MFIHQTLVLVTSSKSTSSSFQNGLKLIQFGFFISLVRLKGNFAVEKPERRRQGKHFGVTFGPFAIRGDYTVYERVYDNF